MKLQDLLILPFQINNLYATKTNFVPLLFFLAAYSTQVCTNVNINQHVANFPNSGKHIGNEGYLTIFKCKNKTYKLQYYISFRDVLISAEIPLQQPSTMIIYWQAFFLDILCFFYMACSTCACYVHVHIKVNMGAWHMSDEVNDVRINYFCHFTMHVFSLNIAYTKIAAVYFVYFLPSE